MACRYERNKGRMRVSDFDWLAAGFMTEGLWWDHDVLDKAYHEDDRDLARWLGYKERSPENEGRPAGFVDPNGPEEFWSGVDCGVAAVAFMAPSDYHVPDDTIDHGMTRSAQVWLGHLYIMEHDGLYKIGRSVRPMARRDQLRKEHGSGVSLLHVVAQGGELERQVHKMFDAERVRGEWFSPSPRLAWLVRQAQERSSRDVLSFVELLRDVEAFAWAV